VPSIEQSIAEKYGIQEAARWTGQPIPQEALLTPEEQEYLISMPKPPSVPGVPSIPAVSGVGGVGGEPARPQMGGIQPEVEAPTGTTLEIKGKLGEIEATGAGITIPISKESLQKIAEAEAKGQCVGAMRTYYTPKLYRVKLKGGGEIYVEELDRELAKQSAKDAGYKVFSVGRVIGDKAPEPTTRPIAEVRETRTGGIPQDEINRIRPSISDNKFLSDALDKAVAANDADIYNNAVGEYNKTVRDAHWYDLYTSYKAISDKEWGKDNWKWFQETYGDKLNDTKHMDYLQSDEFQDKYATIIQPSGMSNEDYNAIKPYIMPQGFDSAAAFEAGKDSPAKAAQIIWSTNQFMSSTLSDDTRAKINSGEWTLLPYGQVIETGKLDQMPPTYRQIVETSGLAGFNDYQEQVHEWNKQEGLAKNTLDAISANAVRLGQDIKNFTLLQLSYVYPKVKEGDPKPTVSSAILDQPFSAQTYTAKEAAEVNAAREARQKFYKNLYDEAEMAAQEWNASRPYLQPVYPAGFVDSVKKDSSSLKDPLLWSETIANTLPYTVATGLIVGGFVGAGPAGVAATAPLAFGITLSVEGHDIYKDAIANGASHEQALKLANIYGSISASIETLGDSVFVGALGVAGGAFSQALGKNVGRNIITSAAKKYGWKNLTAGMIKDFVNQGGQEFFQEVVHNAAIKTVNENQALLENTANAFVSGVIGTAPFVMVPAGGQAISIARGRLADVRVDRSKAGVLTPIDVTPQMQEKILNKVFQPVSGFNVSTKIVMAEQLKGTPAQIEYWKQRYKEGKGRTEYEAGKSITVGLIDKKTVVTGAAKVDETALAYTVMCNKVNEYAYTQLKLKQAQQAIADFGMAKSKAQLKILNEYKERAKELEAKLKELKRPMVEAVKNFSDTFLKNSHGLEAGQKAEVRDMARTIAMDIDSVTTQLFGERNAKEIAKDIKELEGQIKVIEEEMAKGMTRGQLEGYARLISILKGQVGDLVNELRLRYLAEGEKIKPDTKKLAMEVMSLQARLIKAVENLNNFTGSALNYDVYRKGELAREAEVLKLERDTFEAIERTTEAVWGKENYADKLSELNTALRQLVSIMKEADPSHWHTTGISFNIYDALRQKQREKALQKQLKSLKAQIGKINDIPQRQQTEAQVNTVENIMQDLARKSPTELRPSKSGEIGQYTLEYSDADFVAEQNERIHREAERTVGDRFSKLLEHAPSYVRRRTGAELMDYLSQIYDAEYFKTVHDGIFKDLDDYLSVENEEARIRMQVEHQQWLQKMDEQIASYEAEADLAKDLKDDERGKKRRDTLDGYRDKAKKTADKLKEEQKKKQKTRVAVAEAEDTLSDAEKEKLEKIREKLIEERLQRLKDKLKSEEKAKKLIETAKREIAKEEAKEKVETKEEIKAGVEVSPSTMTRILTKYKEQVKPKEQVFTRTALETATKAAVQAAIKAKVDEATKTQTETAIETATETALKEETGTATEEEIETATEIITEIVTKTTPKPKTIIPPKRFRMEPVKGKRKRLREGPALASLKQGLFYISWFPPFKGDKTDVVYSRHKPHYAATAKGRGSPQATLRVFGKVPPLMELPMGAVTARIRHGRKLSYSRRRHKSNRKSRVRA